MARVNKKNLWRLLPALALSLAACGTGSESTSHDVPMGSLSLAVTDAPVDAAVKVVVAFVGVHVQDSSGSWRRFSFSSPRQIDLLNLAGGGSEVLLDEVELPIGRYQAIRLLVNAESQTSDSYIVLDEGGVQRPMHLPSRHQHGLEVKHAFTVTAGGLSAFTIDFDLRKSVVKPFSDHQDYTLKPALRVVNNAVVGRIRGAVDSALLTDPACASDGESAWSNAVYLYPAWGVMPDDIGGSGVEPLASAPVQADAHSATGYSYTLAYVAAGDYTLAFTCQGINDSVEGDEDLHFWRPSNISLSAGAVAKVDFI